MCKIEIDSKQFSKESNFYHQKFMLEDYEIADSPLRIISIAYINK